MGVICYMSFLQPDVNRHTPRERIMEKISMRRTNLEVLSSFDLIVTSIMQSDDDDESMNVSVNRNVQMYPEKRERIRESVREILVLSSFDFIITTSTSDKRERIRE